MLFRQPEYVEDGYPTMIFYCRDVGCGKDEHGFRIFRLAGMDLNVCIRCLNDIQFFSQISALIDAAKSAHPPFGLVACEAKVALLKLAGE